MGKRKKKRPLPQKQQDVNNSVSELEAALAGSSTHTYGGLGGCPDGRPRNFEDEFENAAARALGESMKEDETLCIEVWSALANTEWKHKNGDTASYSFRAAGDLIASIIDRGNYMDWYCSGPYAQISNRVAAAMKKEGWVGTSTPMDF